MNSCDVELLEEIISNKRHEMQELLSRLHDEILCKFERAAANARILLRCSDTFGDTDQEYTSPPFAVGGYEGSLDVIDVCLPMTDAVNRSFASLAHLFVDKTLFNHIVTKMQEYSAMVWSRHTPEVHMEVKEKFDIICKYSERTSKRASNDIQSLCACRIQQNDYNTGHYYQDVSMCQYLMHKTFKKSALGSYESYLRILPLVERICLERLQLSPPFEEGRCHKQVVSFSIAALGGGPASDLTGSVAFLLPTVHRVWQRMTLGKGLRDMRENRTEIKTHIISDDCVYTTTVPSPSPLHRALLVQIDCSVFDLNHTSFRTAAANALETAFSSFNIKKGNGNDIPAISTGYVKNREEWENKVAALYKGQITRQNGVGKRPIAESASVHFTFINKVNDSSACNGISDTDVGNDISFDFVNFLDSSTIPVKLLQKADFVTICWTLNEAHFSRAFWEKVLFEATTEAVLIFVEGKSEELVEINRIADLGYTDSVLEKHVLSRRTIFDLYESPRRLFVLPLAKKVE